ncbi:UNKNOWN [Stylonychia lemnae]|uniref:Uncharacterized protein n=1 Tax=Stylonychia lemnae TaxID=5949 RepID=A0A078A406_STYLE|nr:UNKNOWN [Stylonychia lemnae]|eukprot:CDW77003.1 UNKNOWN [Stylonychia lemnae]
MKNFFLNVFEQPKKEKSKTRLEEVFERKLEKEIQQHQQAKVCFTEPDKHDMNSQGSKITRKTSNHNQHYHNQDDDQPVVKLLNPLASRGPGGVPLSVAEQARQRDLLLQEGAFRRLIIDENLQYQFEQRLDEIERLQKTQNYALYEKDYEIFDKSKMQHKIVFDAIDHLQATKQIQKELDSRKQDYKTYIKSQINRQKPLYTEENYHIIYEEAANLKSQLDEVSEELSELQGRYFQLESLSKSQGLEIDYLREQLTKTTADYEQNTRLARSFKTKLTLARRQNEELTQMKNQEIYKYFNDSELQQSKIEQLNQQIENLMQQNVEQEKLNQKLTNQIEEHKMKKRLKRRKLRELEEMQIDIDQKMCRTLHFLLKGKAIMKLTTEFLTFREYSDLGAINKRFYRDLRGSIGAKSCMHYIKIRHIDQQPQYTIQYKYNVGGGSIAQKLNPNMLSPMVGNQMLCENDISFNSNRSGGQGRMHNYSIASSAGMMGNTMDIMQYANNVSQTELQKLQNDERVKYCISKYINEDHKVALQCEATIQRASSLLISYAQAVFTEDEIIQMKKQSALEDSYDTSFDVPHQQSEATQVVKSSIKQSFGSIMNIFGSNNNNNSSSQNRGTVTSKKQNQPQINSSHIITTSNMYGKDVNSSMFQADQTTQPQNSTILENQIRQGFFLHFKNSEDVYKYLVKVGTVLIVEKDKITQLFKRIQHSYSELFYHGRILYRECKDLELLKDYFKMRLSYLKQKLNVTEKEKDELEKSIKKEREKKEEFFKKSNMMEKRCLEAQAELVSHRQKSYKFDDQNKRLEKKLRDLENEYQENRERLEGENLALRQMYEKMASQKDQLQRALSQYEKFLISTLAKSMN